MQGWRRKLLAAAAVAVVAGLVFVIPTVWGKPWFIEHFYARVFLRFALDSPMLLSQLRILEPYGVHFHEDDLDDFSVAFARERARDVSDALRTLRSYDREAQSPEQLLSTDILGWYLSIQEQGRPFLFHDYPVNQLSGVQSTLPDFMLNVHQVRSRRDAENYRERLAAFGVALDQTIEGLRHREERGVVPPRFVIERVQEELAGFLEPAPRGHVLVTHLAERLDAVDLPAREQRELVEGAAEIVAETVYPAYRRLDAELARLRGLAGDEDGVWKLPDGEDYYAWALRLHTTTDLSADALHELGLAEVERIQTEMRTILRDEGLPADDLVASLRALHEDERFLYEESDAGREHILADYRAIVADARERLPALFGMLPEAPVDVERVPVFKEAGAPGAYYNPPPFDGSRPGIFYVNLRSVREIPRFGMRTLAYHEALPGHHLQIAIAQQLDGLPFFRRVLPFTAYMEGWALYAEQLAVEQGFHPTPFDHLGQLVAEVFRAVRLVVDTGIHARRWSRERAIAYMLANTGMPRTDVVAEIERYIVLPGQACAYKAGQLHLLALRERARTELGGAFDLRDFHDVVLAGGAMPLTLLEQRVDAWISRVRQAAHRDAL